MSVERIWIKGRLIGAVIELARTILLEKANHAGAPRAAIEPDSLSKRKQFH